MASYRPLDFYFDQEFLSMKKHILFTTILSLLLLAVSASAQKAPNFAGTWTMDVAKSRISDREKAVIAFQEIKAVQNDKDISVTTTTKRVPPPDAPKEAAGGPNGAAMGPFSNTSTFTMDGKETVENAPGPNGTTMPVKTSGKWDGSKLVLTTSRTRNEITVVTKDTWDLMADGKTLIIRRDMTGPEGTTTTARVYTKN
jgi:hypothetical protein